MLCIRILCAVGGQDASKQPPSHGMKTARPISGLLTRGQQLSRFLYSTSLLALVTMEFGHLFGCYWIHGLADAGFGRALAL